MAGQKYQNESGVTVTAEQITDPEDECFGFWLTTDANNVQGRVPDELFKQVFKPAIDKPVKGKKTEE